MEMLPKLVKELALSKKFGKALHVLRESEEGKNAEQTRVEIELSEARKFVIRPADSS